MKKRMNNKGFVLAEILLSVAIMAVVSTVAIFGVRNIEKNLKRVKSDEIAREVYIAAQNRMLEIKNNGSLKRLFESIMPDDKDTLNNTFGDNVSKMPSDFNYWKEANGFDDSIFNSYIFSKNGGTFYVLSSHENNGRDLLFNEFLPFGSIHEDIRNSSQLFIEYNLVTTTVYGVFYIDTDVNVSYGELINALGNSGRENGETDISTVRNTRENIKIGDNYMVVGYYGGGIAREASVKTLSVPEVTIENGEDLILKINDTNEENTIISYSVNGLTSGSVKNFTLDPKNKIGSEYKVVLDSLTLKNFEYDSLHFASIFGDSFIPGEDLQITVVARSDDQYIAAPVLTTVVTNSLFERLEDNTAYISSVRHLENLDNRISRLGLSEGLPDKKISVCNAEFLSNISFSGNGADVKNIKNYLEADTITDYSGKAFNNDNYSTFIPVENSDLKEIRGNGHIFFDLYISIDEAERLGLFGYLSDVKITGLGLVGSGITEDWNYDTPVISASENTHMGTCCGAFVAIAEKLQMEKCFSTTRIYLSDDGFLHDSTNIIGGLAGWVKKSCKISDSYTGGMINEYGLYDEKTGNLEGFIPGDGSSGICIGGLIGAFGKKNENTEDELYIKSSYCSSSIKFNIRDNEGNEKSGTAYAGGLVGLLQGRNLHVYIGTDNYMIAPLISDIVPVWSFDETIDYPNIHMGGTIGGIDGTADSISSVDSSASVYLASLYIDYFMDYCGVPGWIVNGFNHYGFDIPANENIKSRNTYGNCINFESISLITKSVSENGAEDIYILSCDQSYPISEELSGKAFPFYECTGLGHHYGDWQFDRHSVGLSVKPGYGIRSVSSRDCYSSDDKTYAVTDLFYSIPICLDEEDSSLAIIHKDGYEGKSFYLEPKRTGSNGILFQIEGHTYFAAGVSDTTVFCDATGLCMPDIAVTGGGAYAFNYADVSLSFYNRQKYELNNKISIYYEIGSTPENDLLTDYEMLNFESIRLKDNYEASSEYIVPKADHYGSKYYWIKAYVSDGRFTSRVFISPPVEVLFSRVRVNGLSGEGWFYD